MGVVKCRWLRAIAQSFNKSFIPYIDNWVRAIYSAAKNKQGILVAWI
ncbi:MAG: hypothetical protein AB4368_02270 [Xenococcaceae cyanobacterium]